MSEFELSKKQKAKISRAIKSLNDVRREFEIDNPDAPSVSWYLEDSENLNFMSDASHDDKGNANYDAVLGLWNLDGADGGGW